MQKSEIRILIVDDDSRLGGTLKEVVAREGYISLHVAKPEEALAQVKLHTYACVVIDCMLPKMNGRDLAQRITTESNMPPAIILTSGIFKDKKFIQESIQKTGARHFLTKPFSTGDLTAKVNECVNHLIDIDLNPVVELMGKKEATPGERIGAFNASENVHGYELPWIFAMLMHPKISGNLSVISAEGEASVIVVSNGEIASVQNKDQKSYFGVLLVEHGFISQEDLDRIVNDPDGKGRLGQRLVEANVLSPHALQIVMAEQQGLRLAKMVRDTSVRLKFEETNEVRVETIIDRRLMLDMFNDWVTSKLPYEWLKTHYQAWNRHRVIKGSEFKANHPAMSGPAVLRASRMLDLFLKIEESGLTLEQLLAQSEVPDREFFPALHNLMLGGCLRFGDELKSSDHKIQRQRLKKLLEDLQRQNYFERLGVSSKARENEIKRSYHEFAKTIHPDKLSPDTPLDIRDLSRQCFNLITEAYQTLQTATVRDNYMLELEQGRAEKIFAAEQSMEQARNYLSKGDAGRAKTLLEDILLTVPVTTELRLLLMWSQIKMPDAERDTDLVGKLKDQLTAIPPEDRHNPTYFFVKGLVQKASKDLEGARRSFEQSVGIDMAFNDAKRELNIINLQIKDNKPVDILRGDLKDVIGQLFGKKK
jgi:CheY-like chemotaxis protein